MANPRRDTLFEEALALSRAERAVFLERACADDVALREDVASLLAAHDAADGFFESLARDAAQPLQQSLTGLDTGMGDEPLTIGEVVAHYRIDARLGRGGMGVVYRATDMRLDRPVALKVLPASRAADARARARLLDEARAAAALDHPHIAAVLDVGTLDGGLAADRMYVAMAYYDGETLANRMARGPVPVAETLRLGRQLTSALAAAHDAGLVHRDVKPSNVLLTAVGDAVRLVDFGIAARVGAELPHTTAARGTRRYMSPERASGAPPDPRADVWSLGLVLRDLLDARGDAELVPEALAALLHRCLDPDPARRPANAGEVLAALQSSSPVATAEPRTGDVAASAPSVTDTRRRTAPPARKTTPRAVSVVSGRSARRLGVVVALFMAVLVGWQLLGRSSRTGASGANTDPRADTRVLVLPFEDQTADPTLAAFGVLAADFVAEAIAATSFAEAVPSITAMAIARDGTVASPGVDRLVHMARPVGAAWVIAGTYLVQGDSLLVRAALASGRDGRVVRTLQTVTSDRRAPGEALSALARNAVVVTALELDPLVRSDPMLPVSAPQWDAYEAFARGKEHFLARRYPEAIAAFDEAYARDSSLRNPLFYQGMVYVNTGNWERLHEVVTMYRQRQSARSDPSERLVLGVLESFLMGDRAGVYRVHREAETFGFITPGMIGHFSMGAAAFDLGRPREAITIVRQSDPERGELKGWSSYYDVLAQAHLWLGEYDAALDAARRLQADHPALDLGARRAMQTLAAQGRLAPLDSVLEAALQSSPDPGALLRFAGNVLWIAGYSDAAQRQFRRAVGAERAAIERGGGRPSAAVRSALSESLLLAGELEEAEQLLQALAREQPTSMSPITGLARIAARRGDTATVATLDRWLAERATERFNRGTATYRRARIAAVQGDGERAARLLEQSMREGEGVYHVIWTDPDFAEVRAHPAMRALLAPRG